MITIKIITGNDLITVVMTDRERGIINDCLCFLCYAQIPPDFEAIAGAPQDKVEEVQRCLRSISRRRDSGSSAGAKPEHRWRGYPRKRLL
jgi:hypothetical protein